MAMIPDMCFLRLGDPSDSQWVSCRGEHRVGEAFLPRPLPAMAWVLAGKVQRCVRGDPPILAAHAPAILFSPGFVGSTAVDREVHGNAMVGQCGSEGERGKG
jgi:hypothetical protein